MGSLKSSFVGFRTKYAQDELIWIFFAFVYMSYAYGVFRVPSIEARAAPCKASLATMKKVQRCPVSKSEWLESARLKQCSSVNQTCMPADLFQYHCVLNDYADTLIEVCGRRTMIIGNACVEFNQGGIIIMESDVTCDNRNNKCPFRYWSNKSYKYPQCYNFNNQSTTLSYETSEIATESQDITNKTTTRNEVVKDSWKIIPILIIVGACFVTAIGIIIGIYAWKKVKPKKKGQTRMENRIKENDVVIYVSDGDTETEQNDERNKLLSKDSEQISKSKENAAVYEDVTSVHTFSDKVTEGNGETDSNLHENSEHISILKENDTEHDGVISVPPVGDKGTEEEKRTTISDHPNSTKKFITTPTDVTDKDMINLNSETYPHEYKTLSLGEEENVSLTHQTDHHIVTAEVHTTPAIIGNRSIKLGGTVRGDYEDDDKSSFPSAKYNNNERHDSSNQKTQSVVHQSGKIQEDEDKSSFPPIKYDTKNKYESSSYQETSSEIPAKEPKASWNKSVGTVERTTKPIEKDNKEKLQLNKGRTNYVAMAPKAYSNPSVGTVETANKPIEKKNKDMHLNKGRTNYVKKKQKESAVQYKHRNDTNNTSIPNEDRVVNSNSGDTSSDVTQNKIVYLAYKNSGIRQKSFDGCTDTEFKKRASDLACAGFFYKGFGKFVICFHCGVEISDWNDTEDPMIKHRFRNPTCPFVLENNWMSGELPK